MSNFISAENFWRMRGQNRRNRWTAAQIMARPDTAQWVRRIMFRLRYNQIHRISNAGRVRRLWAKRVLRNWARSRKRKGPARKPFGILRKPPRGRPMNFRFNYRDNENNPYNVFD